MNFINHQLSISPLRWTAAVIGVAAVWLLMPEIVQAAVTFGEIGENVAENAKGVAKGVTLAGYASGAGMGVWGCVDMYKATKSRFWSEPCCSVWEKPSVPARPRFSEPIRPPA